MRIGAHVSIAGGMDLAIDRGIELGCEAIQVFTKNNNQWRAAPLTDEVVARFHAKLRASPLHPVVAHAAYLINLATSDDALWKKSIESFEGELERCDRLKIRYMVVHPGSHMGAGEEVGIRRVAEALTQIYDRRGFEVVTCLEHTAGQGNHLGYTLEHLAAIRDRVTPRNRVGVCLDTCHLFAAGMDFRKPEAYVSLMQRIDDVLGLAQIKCIHLNDSKTPLGSRVDRHEHIGKGRIGRAGFGHWLNDPRWTELPGLIETPTDPTISYERRNLAVLRRLRKAPASAV